MAKKTTKKIDSAPSVDVDLLKAINEGRVSYVSETEGTPLLAANLIEVNPSVTDPDDSAKVAARLTEAGIAMITDSVETVETVEVSTPVVAAQVAQATTTAYPIITGATLPSPKRGGGRGAAKKYDFDALGVGDSFFVTVTEKLPEPWKSLGSIVNTANHRYAVETGETKTITRKKRGTEETETIVRPVLHYNRKFVIRRVYAGTTYGTWTAPADGALIQREV